MFSGSFPFADFLQGFADPYRSFHTPHHPEPPAPRSPNDPSPPAAPRVLSRLPEVVITKADLDEDAEHNLECSICLSEQRIGHLALKLPCGHLFCKACVLPWLNRRCSCPSCRFELETDDPEYEIVRRQKMKNFRFRFRRGELTSMSPSALRALAASLGLSTVGCLEKSDIIQKIADSNRVLILESSPQVYSTAELFRLSGAELKNLMSSLGVVPPLGAAEKTDLVAALALSGRITISSDSTTTSPPVPTSPRPSEPSATSGPSAARTGLERSQLLKLRVGELKQLLQARGITGNFLEKADMVDALLSSTS